MPINKSIKEDVQKLNIGNALISLFKLDASSLGGNITYFCQGPLDGEILEFGGVEYPPLPVEIEGFDYSSGGKLPRPIIRISNVLYSFLVEIITLNDLVGATITRRRTFKKYLDGELNADSNAQFPSDIYYVERKIKQNKNIIEWELISALDLEYLMVPRRQCLDICTHMYGMSEPGVLRPWATCPYIGSDYFDTEGNTVSFADDKCGKRLFDCKLRYPGDGDKLPFRGFPGIGMVSQAYR
jgi:lambda family phage minor tail protein L